MESEDETVIMHHCSFSDFDSCESLLDCKEIQPVHSKGDQPWVFFGRNDAEAKAPILWPLYMKADSLEKTLMVGKTEGKRRRGLKRIM